MGPYHDRMGFQLDVSEGLRFPFSPVELAIAFADELVDVAQKGAALPAHFRHDLGAEANEARSGCWPRFTPLLVGGFLELAHGCVLAGQGQGVRS